MRAFPGDCVGTFLSRPVANSVRFDVAVERLADRLLLRGHGFTHAVLAQGVTKLGECALMPEKSAAANVFGPMRAIDDLLDAGVHPIFLSSDAVFDGTGGPRAEEAPPHPLLSYGRQKLAVEEYLRAKTEGWTILRLCRVVASFVDERNLLSAWLDSIVRSEPIFCATDQILSPLDVDDVVRLVDLFVRTEANGLYHVASSETITRHELLMELLKQVPASYRSRAIIKPCRLRDISTPERLPLNCSLNSDKLRALCGFQFNPMETICSRLCRNAFPESSSLGRAEQTPCGEAEQFVQS
jgi:dTDP-4-dehydrorhamnose reductase